MKRLNIILIIVAVVLAALCVNSVYAPIRFDNERSRRELAVKQRLLKIRSAAELYRQKTGAYTGSMAKLVDSRCLADSLQYIPYSGGKRFRLAASSVTTSSGRVVPVMECSATYSDYLHGLNPEAISNLTSAADYAGHFAGLKIGDLTTPNDNAGNWE